MKLKLQIDVQKRDGKNWSREDVEGCLISTLEGMEFDVEESVYQVEEIIGGW